MTDKELETTQNKSPTAKAAEGISDQPERKPAAKKSNGSGYRLGTLVSLLSLIIVIAVSYLGYQVYLPLHNSIEQIKQQQSLVSKQRLEQLQAQTITIQGLRQQLEALEEQQKVDSLGLSKQLLTYEQRLSEVEGKSSRSWYLDEALYLLRIANNRLLFMADFKTALALVKQADALLAKIDDAQLYATRRALASDLQRLQSYPELDRTGLAIRVAAMQTKLDNLPLLRLVTSESPEVAQMAPPAQTWYQHLTNSLKQLGEQWFEVRPHNSGFSPIISEKEEHQLRFNLMLTLQTIQFAIIHQDADLFSANLLQFRGRLQQYFNVEDSSVQALLLEVERLLEYPVVAGPVTGLESLPALQNYKAQTAGSSQDQELATAKTEAER